jgi:hypothetical protein
VQKRASIGLKAKTARAIAVVLSGSTSSPEFVCREELSLSDDEVPATMQPYHAVMELTWSESLIAVQPTIRAIQRVTNESLARLIEKVEASGIRIDVVAVVGAPDRQLEKIGNPHIRAHGAEGVLFRQVLEVAAKANHRRSRSFVERDLDRVAKSELKRSSAQIKKSLAALGESAGPPWRADEKAAAIASWIALAR